MKKVTRKLKADDVMADPGPFLTIPEVAAVFKCSPITLRRRIAAGEAKGLDLMDPFGLGRPLISKKSLDAYISRRAQATAKEFKPAPHLYAAP